MTVSVPTDVSVFVDYDSDPATQRCKASAGDRRTKELDLEVVPEGIPDAPPLSVYQTSMVLGNRATAQMSLLRASQDPVGRFSNRCHRCIPSYQNASMRAPFGAIHRISCVFDIQCSEYTAVDRAALPAGATWYRVHDTPCTMIKQPSTEPFGLIHHMFIIFCSRACALKPPPMAALVAGAI